MVDFSPSPHLDIETNQEQSEIKRQSTFVNAATNYKQAARDAMLRDGVHKMFLEDSHWAQLWSKHFERSERSRQALPFDEPLSCSFEGCNLRVLQWNLLAEGLVPEGFLMPLVSKAHVANLDKYIADLLLSGKPEDLDTLARCSSQGHRSLVWREGSDGNDGSWEDFARMACDMVSTMKGLPPNEKEAHGLELKARYSPDAPEGGPGGGGQLAVNEHAVTGAEQRMLRVLWFVTLLQPDIIAFQEVDNFAFLAQELAKLGYNCGREDAEKYVPLKDREGDSYAKKLESSPWAFAPKWGAKRGKSTARHFLEKRIADGASTKASFLGRDDWPTDDDGQAIFWRRDRFQLIGSPEFLLLPGQKDVDAFIEGKTDTVEVTHGDQAAVRVLLEFNVAGERIEGQQFFVNTTHLSSGLDCEVYRIQELCHLGRAWGRSGLPEIWAFDANTEIDFEDLDGEKGSAMRIPKEANALQNFMQDEGLRTVWEACYDLDGDESTTTWAPPASVWKMRGSASAQPKKVGEDMYQLIDHIFFAGRSLFSHGQQALRLRERLDGDPTDRDWLALIPNELLPSDHLPIAWDFKLNMKSPRREAPVLLSTAQRIWRRLATVLPPQLASSKLPAEVDRLVWLPQPEKPPSQNDVLAWLTKVAQDADMVLDGTGVSGSGQLEELRWHLIGARGRHSKEDAECCLLAGLVFAAAAAISSGAPLAIASGARRSTDSEIATLPVAASVRIALAALRYVLRAYLVVGTEDSGGQLWGLAAQVTEALATSHGGYQSCRHIRAAFDAQGKVSGAELDALLVEVSAKLATSSTPNAPALLVLRCVDWRAGATGTQVAAAARTVLRAIEAGNVEFGSSGPSGSPRTPASGSGVAAVMALRKEYNLLQQTFDQSAVNAAFTALGESGNLDSGGGLALLMQTMHSHLAFAEQCREGSALPERQARALNRPPPLLVASAVRRAVVSACQAVWPVEVLLAKAQKLDVRQPAAARSGGNNSRSPVYGLISALWQIPHLDVRSQMETVRKIIDILGQLFEQAGAAAIMPPLVHGGGMTRCKDILKSLKQLDEHDLQRWRTLEMLTKFLDTLLNSDVRDDALASALQASIRATVQEPEFQELFLLRPEATDLPDAAAGPAMELLNVTGNLSKYKLVQELSSSLKMSGAEAAAGP